MIGDLYAQRIIALLGMVSLTFLLLTASWTMILISYIYYKIVVAMLGNQIAQHRYFSHRNFTTSRFKQWILYFSSLTTGINPVHYALAHRHHHAHSDTDLDIHSPCHQWWDIFSPLTHHVRPTNIKVSKVLDSSLQVSINRFWWLIFAGYCCVFALMHWSWAIYFALAGVGWNYLHMILLRVWLVHIKLPGSYRNVDTADQSWNNRWLQLLDWGEGLHNNHHARPDLFDQALRSDEIDPVGHIVRWCFVRPRAP